MRTLHFRYSWIAPAHLTGLFPSSLEVGAIRALVEARHAILSSDFRRTDCNEIRSPALRVVLAWFHRPRWHNPPAPRQIRKGRHIAEQLRDCDLTAVVDWVEEAVTEITEAKKRQGPAYREAVSFLEKLSQTDFPALLAWRNQALASRLYAQVPQQNPALRDKFREERRPTIQAAQTCISYALAGVGRLAPRQAWVGVGFAVASELCTAKTQSICRSQERLEAEPDLAWIDRNWQDLEPLELAPGVLPWEYLQLRIQRQSVSSVKTRYQAILDGLIAARKSLLADPWCFSNVQIFLQRTAAILNATVETENGRQDPHQWWVTRLLEGESELPASLFQRCESARNGVLGNLSSKGHTQPRVHGAELASVAPYPERVRQQCPDAVVAPAEEYIDWLLRSPGMDMPEMPLPRITAGDRAGTGDIYTLTEAGLSYLYSDPNPLRCAERFAPHYASTPRYSVQPERAASTALCPPTGLLDNRLVRLPREEVPIDSISDTDSAAFYSTLVCDKTMPLISRELQSPVYRRVPDIVPRFLHPCDADFSAGDFCPDSQTWAFVGEQLEHVCRQVKSGRQLAFIYYLEINSLLKKPEWLDLLVDGKRSTMPLHSLLLWEHLYHVLRTATNSVALSAPAHAQQCDAVWTDGEDRALNVMLCVNAPDAR